MFAKGAAKYAQIPTSDAANFMGYGHDEFYRVAFRKEIYEDLESLQLDLDEWSHCYNHERTHQGKMCSGRTPMETLDDCKKIWREKKLN